MQTTRSLRWSLWELTHPYSFRKDNIPVALECCCGRPIVEDVRETLPHRKLGCGDCYARFGAKSEEPLCCRWIQYKHGVTLHAEGYFVPKWLQDDLSEKKEILHAAVENHRAELDNYNVSIPEKGAANLFQELEQRAKILLGRIFSDKLGDLLPPHFNTVRRTCYRARTEPRFKVIPDFKKEFETLRSRLWEVDKENWYLRYPCKWAIELEPQLPMVQDRNDSFTLQDVEGGQRIVVACLLVWDCLKKLLEIAGYGESDGLMVQVQKIVVVLLQAAEEHFKSPPGLRRT